MAFAKMPSTWAKQKARLVPTNEGAEVFAGRPVDFLDDPHHVLRYDGLSMFQWRSHKSHATAALLILFALAIISNKAQRQNGLRVNEQVAATYEEIQEVVPLSRKLIAAGLKLLRLSGAITTHEHGNRSVHTLHGIETNGHWCALPQSHLLNGFKHLHRLQLFIDQIKRPASLRALKLYMLLLAFRDNHTNAARMTYEHIAEYTGLRREETKAAIELLVATELCRLAGDDEIPRRKGDGMHNRYVIRGLKAS